MVPRGLVVVYLAVLELALQHLLGEGRLPRGHLLQCLAYLGACLRRGDDVQPVLFGRLRVRCHDFHLVAALQPLAQGHVLAVHPCTDAATSQGCVDVEGKVQHRGSLGQLEEVALGGEDEDLVLVQLQFEAVHGLEVAL